MNCRNHPDVEATYTAAMPTADKQPDGSYEDTVPMCADCADRTATIGFTVTLVGVKEITDGQIVGVIAEHLVTLFEALGGNGIAPERSLRCASRALIDLDTLAAEAGNRLLEAAPTHGEAILALDLLEKSLALLTTTGAAALQPTPLLAPFQATLGAIRTAVQDHWMALSNGQGMTPKLWLPNGNGKLS